MTVTRPVRMTYEDQVAAVDPVGARVTQYDVGQTQVLAGAERPDQFAYRGSLLAPWPNRVTDGVWSWRGQQLQLPLNDPTGVRSALHGLVVHAEFDLVEQSSSALRLVHHLPSTDGYPFPLRLEVAYALADRGLVCSLTAVNEGTRAAPVGLGVHPYVAAADLVDDLVLTLPADTALVTDAQWREVARAPVGDVDLDFRRGRLLRAQEIDGAFTDLQRAGQGIEVGLARSDGHEVMLWSGGTCRWLVVYTGDTLPPVDRRRSIAVEPMTCPPNALATGEIDVLEPQASLTLDWGFTLRRQPASPER